MSEQWHFQWHSKCEQFSSSISPGQQPNLASSPNISIWSWFLYPRTDTAFYCHTLALLLHDQLVSYYNIIPLFNRYNFSWNKSFWCTILPCFLMTGLTEVNVFTSIQYFIHKILRTQEKNLTSNVTFKNKKSSNSKLSEFNFLLHLWESLQRFLNHVIDLVSDLFPLSELRGMLKKSNHSKLNIELFSSNSSF